VKTKALRRAVCDPALGAAVALTGAGLGRLSYAQLVRLSRRLAGPAARLAPGTRTLIRTNLQVAFPDWSESRLRTVTVAEFRKEYHLGKAPIPPGWRDSLPAPASAPAGNSVNRSRLA